MKRGLIVLAASLGCCVASTAGAVTRTCRWNIASVPVFVNLSSFLSRGVTEFEIKSAITNAFQSWNTEGAANIQMTYAGNSALTTAAANTILVVAQPVAAGCMLANTSHSTPSCSAATIVIYDRFREGCIDGLDPAGNPNGAIPVDWANDAPFPLNYSLTNVLAQNFARAIGGYTLDPMNTNTVMQPIKTGESKSLHLYNVDIDLLKNGDASTSITGYGRRANTVRAMDSSDGVVWSNLPIGSPLSALRPAVAASSVEKVMAWVDTSGIGVDKVITRRFTAAGGEVPITLGPTSRVGVALAANGSRFLLVYPSAADTRELKLHISTTGGMSWGAASTISASFRSQSAPAIAFNSVSGRFYLFWTDIDSDRLRYASSTDGTSWTTSAEIGPGSDGRREHYALDGPAAACEAGADRCFLQWGSWNSYDGLNTALCTQKWTQGAMGATSITPGDMSCLTIDSGRSPGIAFKSGTGWLSVRAAKDAASSLITGMKPAMPPGTGWDTSVEWSNLTTLPVSNGSGVDATFNPRTSNYELVFVLR